MVTVATSWVDAAEAAAAGRDRSFVASPFAAEAARVERNLGATARAAFVRNVMEALIDRGRPRIAAQNLPAAVKALVESEFRRISKDLSTANDTHYDLSRHSTRCDFRIVGFGRIPVGVHHVEVGGVPRSLLWRGSVSQAYRTAALFLRAGGWAPFYVAHFSHRIRPHAFLLVYTPEALAAWHRNVADCLRLNPGVRGLLSTSWWYDPQLARVAPHLTFLRDGSLAQGATPLRWGSTKGAREYAVANSPERQRLYEAGDYLPVSYAMVWTREALLKWADA